MLSASQNRAFGLIMNNIKQWSSYLPRNIPQKPNSFCFDCQFCELCGSHIDSSSSSNGHNRKTKAKGNILLQFHYQIDWKGKHSRIFVVLVRKRRRCAPVALPKRRLTLCSGQMLILNSQAHPQATKLKSYRSQMMRWSVSFYQRYLWPVKVCQIPTTKMIRAFQTMRAYSKNNRQRNALLQRNLNRATSTFSRMVSALFFFIVIR